MNSGGKQNGPNGQSQPNLQVYLLGTVEFEAAMALQRRLVYQISGDRAQAAMLLCEHPPMISVGREGSWSHLAGDPGEPRKLPVRWVNRGGGCFLHVPGQLAIYPIVPLDRLGLGIQAYLQLLQEVISAVLDDFGIRAHFRDGQAGVWVGQRPIAGLGIAVRDWVTYYGAILNINPDLKPFQLIRAGWARGELMTSLERERRGPLRPSLVRERFLEHFSRQFQFAGSSLFFDHPALERKARSDAVATHP